MLILMMLINSFLAQAAPEDCVLANDFSGLNETCVAAISRPSSEAEVVEAIAYAKSRGWKISLAGSQHSMAGQSLTPGGLMMDMKNFKQILAFDQEKKLITVQTGITWAEVQAFLDPKRLAVDVMQDYNIFTVGGSLSVNAYSWNTHSSNIASTVESIKILMSNGQIKTASRQQNPELFSLALGGYGLFGIILEATLKVTDNVLFQVQMHKLNYRDFPSFFEKNLAGKNAMMHNYLSLKPDNFLKDMVLISYVPTGKPRDPLPPLKRNLREEKLAPILGWIVNKGKYWDFPGEIWKELVWFLQSRLLVRTIPDPISRNQIMSRTLPKVAHHEDGESFVIQVYMVPKVKFAEMTDILRKKVLQHQPSLVTASVSHSLKDQTAFLSTAGKEDRFSFVLGFIQPMTAKAAEEMRKFNQEMIDEVLKLGGTYYLAQRSDYTPEQLRLLYPQVDDFFALKRIYDPEETFSNMFYEKYGQIQ